MRIAPLLALALFLGACADEPSTSSSPDAVVPEAADASASTAHAVFDGLDGSGVTGSASFQETDGALSIRVALAGLAPGEHGFHVHEGSSCGPDSTGTPGGAAGDHFNPLASEHGAPTALPADRHAGDLGNVIASAEGAVASTVVDSVLTLDGPTSVIGHAVVVHAGADDLASQPSGDAGERVACGVVVAGDPEAASGAGP